MMNRTASTLVVVLAAFVLTVTGCDSSTPGGDTDPSGQAQSPDTTAPTDAAGTEGGGTDGGATGGGETDGGQDTGGGAEDGNEEPTENPNVTIGGPVVIRPDGTPIGDHYEDLVDLENGSDSEITLGPAEIANENASNPFTFEDGSTTATLCGGVLPAQGSCSFVVRFTPTEIGVQLATLTVLFPADNTMVTRTFQGKGKQATVGDQLGGTIPDEQGPVKGSDSTPTPTP